MAPIPSLVINLSFTLLILALFTTSVLASGTAVSVATATQNATYTAHAPTATSPETTSTPSNMVSGSSTLDPLTQILIFISVGIWSVFAIGM
ncbi:hypothetical protein N431DRAFT_430313 [Stipitochalara longipes BDJ]|nr:hypothetical protein N431DRAFT_430313 [Stipitochalara longipes BDJ]